MNESFRLNTDQQDAVIMLKWLLDGPRMSGRSIAIAYYIVEKAYITGTKVKLFDHTELNSGERRPESRKYILEKCKQLALELYPNYNFAHYLSDNSISIRHIK